MRIVSRLLEGIVALVFVFGLLESLLTGGKAGARGLGRSGIKSLIRRGLHSEVRPTRKLADPCTAPRDRSPATRIRQHPLEGD